MELSARMQMIADLMGKCHTLADVGCDHGYLSVAAITQGKAENVIATDLREGPLSRGRQTGKEAGLEEKITFRLSDGLTQIRPGEADAILLAGMGGELILRILEEGREVVAKSTSLILSPHSMVEAVRRKTEELGFAIEEERMVKEEGIFYTAFRAVPGTAPYGNLLYYRFGKTTLERKDPVLLDYLLWKEKVTENILSNLPQGEDSPAIKEREEALEEEKSRIKEALERYEME